MKIKKSKYFNGTMVFFYLAFMVLNILYAIQAYRDFKITYANQSFSEGIWGILICIGANIWIGIVMTIVLFLLINNKKKKEKNE